MTGIKKLDGMPVMTGGRLVGHVVRGVLSRDGRHLAGLVVKGKMGGTKWLGRKEILLIGKMAVIAAADPGKVPDDAQYRLYRVSGADGERIGIVTDAIIYEETLRVAALEISQGPVDDLVTGRWYTTAFSVLPGKHTGHVTIIQNEGR